MTYETENITFSHCREKQTCACECEQQTAYQYAKKGAVLVLVARREGRLRMVADRSIKRGAMDVRAITADVSKEDDCRRVIEDTVNHYGRRKWFFICYIFYMIYISQYDGFVKTKAQIFL